MPYNRPSIATILGRITADIQAQLSGVDPTLRRKLLTALAKAETGAVNGLYSDLNWMAMQIMPDTAESDELDRWASIWGKTRKSATYAGGDVDFTGTTGTLIAAGSLVQRSDGTQYSLDADVTLVAGSGTVSVTAADSGVNGNTVAASQFTLVQAISGVDSAVTVGANGLTGGADIETDAELLSRLLARIQQAPHGGNADDYVGWALEVAGVTRAWCYPREMGIGTVTVRFMMDDVYPDGIPQAADVSTVLDYIQTQCPVHLHDGYGLYVAAPIAAPLDPSITLTPNNAAVQAAVQAELADLIRREAEPGGNIQVAGAMTAIGGLLLSHINEAISIATGETDHVLTSPAADVAAATGNIVTLGVITWA